MTRPISNFFMSVSWAVALWVLALSPSYAQESGIRADKGEPLSHCLEKYTNLMTVADMDEKTIRTAINQCEAALSARPGDESMALRLGVLYVQAKEYQKAKTLLKPLAQAAPQNASERNITSQLSGISQGKVEDARAFYTAILAAQSKGISAKNQAPLAQEVIAWFTPYADGGDLGAQLILAELYSRAVFLPKALEQSVGWYEKAIEQGHTPARISLAKIYANEKFSGYDNTKAVAILRDLGEKGNDVALVELGNLYQRGPKAMRDIDKAVAVYQTLEDRGNGYGYGLLGMIYLNEGSGYYNPDQGLRLLTQGAEKTKAFGFALALGILYYLGSQDIPQDLNKARTWFCMTPQSRQMFRNVYEDSDVFFPEGKLVCKD